MERISLCSFIICIFILDIEGQDEKGHLIKSLLENYEEGGGKLVIPDITGTVNVTHSLALRRILGLENQVLTIDVYASLNWLDSRLTWDPDVSNISSIRLPTRYLWQPDVILYNSADDKTVTQDGEINSIITYDGSIFYTAPVKMRSFCKVKASSLKRKKKVTCVLKFGSWTHDGLSLDLFTESKVMDMSSYDATFNREWKILSTSVKRNVVIYDCCPEPYVDLTYTLVMKYRGS